MSKDIVGVTAGHSAQPARDVAALVRKTWQTPQVILGRLEQAELNAGLTDDGDVLLTPDNS